MNYITCISRGEGVRKGKYTKSSLPATGLHSKEEENGPVKYETGSDDLLSQAIVGPRATKVAIAYSGERTRRA